MAERYWQLGFRDFKVKLSGDAGRDREKMDVFREWPAESVRVRADANNLWPSADDAIAALRGLQFPFFAVEEPIGSNRHAELPRIARALGCRIVLDESLVRREQLALLDEPAVAVDRQRPRVEDGRAHPLAACRRMTHALAASA